MGNTVKVSMKKKAPKKMYMITIYQKYVEEGKVLGIGTISEVGDMIRQNVHYIEKAADILSMDLKDMRETAVIDGEEYVTGWHIYLNSLEWTHRIVIDEYKTQG